MRNDPLTMTLLLDEYGALLTEKQRDCCDLYFNQDLSLAEIAEELGISRQGVHDSLTRAEAAMAEMEDALGNVARAKKLRNATERIGSWAKLLQTSEDPEVRRIAGQIAAAAAELSA